MFRKVRADLCLLPCDTSQDPNRAFLTGGDLNPGERHSRDTRNDGTVALCTLRAATVLSRDCRADFGRPITKVVMSHLRDGPGVTAPLQRTLYLSPGCGIPPLRLPPPPLKSRRPNRNCSDKTCSDELFYLGWIFSGGFSSPDWRQMLFISPSYSVLWRPRQGPKGFPQKRCP